MAEGWLWLSMRSATAIPSRRRSPRRSRPAPRAPGALGGQAAQVQPGRLVRAVLAPHHRVQGQLEMVGGTTQDLADGLDSSSVRPSARCRGSSAGGWSGGGAPAEGVMVPSTIEAAAGPSPQGPGGGTGRRRLGTLSPGRHRTEGITMANAGTRQSTTTADVAIDPAAPYGYTRATTLQAHFEQSAADGPHVRRVERGRNEGARGRPRPRGRRRQGHRHRRRGFGAGGGRLPRSPRVAGTSAGAIAAALDRRDRRRGATRT